MQNVKIAPSILSADFSVMGEEVKKLKGYGADLVHCDVMDGVFVKNITFGPKMIKDIRKCTDLPLDVHLMIVEPWNYVEKFAEAGADFITVHAEAAGDRLSETLKQIKSLGVKCGAVINPDTPVSAVEKSAELCDMLLLMSVFPGFGGQKFIEYVLPKIGQARRLIADIGKDILLEVDGGVTFENAAAVKSAGADVLVAGSTVFNHADRKEAVRVLKMSR